MRKYLETKNSFFYRAREFFLEKENIWSSEEKENREGKGGNYLEKEINDDVNQLTNQVNLEQCAFPKVRQ